MEGVAKVRDEYNNNFVQPSGFLINTNRRQPMPPYFDPTNKHSDVACNVLVWVVDLERYIVLFVLSGYSKHSD